MAQGFSMRESPINGHGNFGSVDNDPPAICGTRMSLASSHRGRPAATLNQTIDFTDSFDFPAEPLVLLARIPQLLLNGSSVPWAPGSNIPPTA